MRYFHSHCLTFNEIINEFQDEAKVSDCYNLHSHPNLPVFVRKPALNEIL